MIGLLRFALQVVLFFLLVGLVVGIASAQTGLAEKIVLAGLIAMLVWVASLVRRVHPGLHRV